MYTIATLEALRQHLGLGAADTAEDARLLRALTAATASMERLTGRRFCPHVAEIAHSFRLSHADELLLLDDLLELHSLTNGDGSSINPQDVIRLPQDPAGPAAVLRLLPPLAFVCETTPLNAVQVAGVWGWHDRWPQAWRDSGETLSAELAAAASALVVSDVAGADSAGQTPRFQTGHLLRIGGEYVRVLAVDRETDTLTLRRGVSGTQAQAHEGGTVIECYQPARDVESLCLRWAAALYREPDTLQPPETPLFLSGLLAALRRIRVA